MAVWSATFQRKRVQSGRLKAAKGPRFMEKSAGKLQPAIWAGSLQAVCHVRLDLHGHNIGDIQRSGGGSCGKRWGWSWT